MTKFKTIQTLAMATTKNDFKENVEGLLEGHNLVQGWDDSNEDDFEEIETEEDEAIVALKDSAKPHFLDRKDRVLLGGFIRRSFYKKTQGKNPVTLTAASTSEDFSCRCCSTKLSTQIKNDNVTGSVQFTQFFTKEKDSQNRDLSEIALSLLQLFDWTATCACGEIHYGYIKAEGDTVSFSDKVHKMTEKAATLAVSAFSPDTASDSSPEEPKKLRLQQMSLFDFLEETTS